MRYVFPSRLGKYMDSDELGKKSWLGRETGRNVLMITNMLKRLESSVYAFRKTSERMYDLIDGITDSIDRFEQGRESTATVNQTNLTFDVYDEDPEEAEWTVGKDLKIDFADIDLVSSDIGLRRVGNLPTSESE